VEQWIEQLASKDFRKRQAADKALRELGINALPALRKAQASDAEVRLHLDRLIASLERETALRPKRITLDMDQKPIAVIVAEIAKQSGYKINPPPLPTGTTKVQRVYSFHFKDTLFWQALDQVCDASGMILHRNPGDDALHLSFQESYVPFKSYDGTFRVVATGFYYWRNLNLDSRRRDGSQYWWDDRENLTFSISVGTEPRLPLIKLGAVRLLRADDDQKHSMLLRDYNDYYYGRFGRMFYRGGVVRNFVMDANVGLLLPARSAKTVKILKGIIPITLLADTKAVVITDKLLSAQGQKFDRPDVSFSIDGITRLANNQCQITVSFTDKGGNNPYDYNGIYNMPNRIEVQDEKGNKIPAYVGFRSINWPNSGSFVLTTQAAGPGRVVATASGRVSRPAVAAGGSPTTLPAKLIYQHWVLMEHEVAFEFRGLPLP
jgi:hypothetical protein